MPSDINPSEMTIGEFIIWYLENHKRGYVHQMLNAFNKLRENSPTKRQMKYSSFRTIIWNMKYDGYIKSKTPRDPDYPYEKSYYSLGDKPYVPGTKKRPKGKGANQ